MEFTVSGQKVEVTADGVTRALAGVVPEPARQHVVSVGGKEYPVKQAMAVATGLDRLDFTSAQARSVLKRLGFQLHRLDSD